MHLPDHFAWRDPASTLAFCRAHPFAVVAAEGGDGVEAQHLPLLVDVCDDGLVLHGHVALGNPLWHAGRALAIFHGPHAYISAAWYGEPNTVPTWNYLAVHAAGPLTTVTDPKAVRILFDRLAAGDSTAATWQSALDQDRYDRLAAGVRWFRMDATHVQAKAKLSQNHSVERRDRISQRLLQASDQQARTIGEAMARTLIGQQPWT